jgi:hypothetical protein
MRLQQHLGYTGRPAKVSVDLKGRMVIEQVGERGFGKQLPDMVIRIVAIQETGIEIDDPGPAPAGVAAAVPQPGLNGPLRGFKQLRRGRGNLGSWMESQQV